MARGNGTMEGWAGCFGSGRYRKRLLSVTLWKTIIHVALSRSDKTTKVMTSMISLQTSTVKATVRIQMLTIYSFRPRN